MRNPHGMPIWYELLSTDADASKAFYADVIGWDVGPKPEGDMDYRMIVTSAGDNVGGLMNLSPEMTAGGAKPTWLFYIGADDVDATVAKISALGGSVHLPAFDMPGVGRMAMLTDPQGIAFYVMRGASDQASTVWERSGMGKCNWHELVTPDQAAGNAFYAEVFGWTFPDRMTMPGDLGDYVFVEAAGETIGATMTVNDHQPTSGWLFYFRAPDIKAAAAKVTAGGGIVLMGPHEVPGGDRIIVASDPQGVAFGVAAPA